MVLKVLLTLKMQMKVERNCIDYKHSSFDKIEEKQACEDLFVFLKHRKVELSQLVGCFDKKPIAYNHIPSKYDEYMHEFD